MASSWTWTGATSSSWTDAGNWTFETGDNNANGYPIPGDTADVGVGTNALSLTGATTASNTINLTGGAVLNIADGTTLDGKSTINGLAGTINVAGTFTDLGNIQVRSKQNLEISLAGGSTLVSDGTGGLDIGLNNGDAGAFDGGTLTVVGGTLYNQEVHANGGYTLVNMALANNDEMSVDGGTLEVAQTTTTSPMDIIFVSTDSADPSTLKFDNPGSFNADGLGIIRNFKSFDTIDIGANTVGTIVFNADAGIGGGTLVVENSSGSQIFSAILEGGDSGSFATGSAVVNNGTAGSFLVQTVNGDTQISEAATAGTTTPGATTWTWNGTSGNYNSANWTATSGSGNGNNYPANGDSVIIPSGTVGVSGATLDLVNAQLGSGASLYMLTGGSLEVNSGLALDGGSITVDDSSGLDLGTAGSFTNGAVQIDNAATLSGTGLVDAAVVDNGAIAVGAGTMKITRALSGSGIVSFGAGSTLMLDQAVASGPTFNFNAGTNEALLLISPGSGFSDALVQLMNGDRIEFGNGETITSATFVNDQTIVANIAGGGTYDLTNVSFANGSGTTLATGIDGSGNSYIEVTGTISSGGGGGGGGGGNGGGGGGSGGGSTGGGSTVAPIDITIYGGTVVATSGTDGSVVQTLPPVSSSTMQFITVDGVQYGTNLASAESLGVDPGALRDYDGNNLGSAGGWQMIGLGSVRVGARPSYILDNPQNGRWAEVGVASNGQINMSNYGANGDTRVVGIYIDPGVASGQVQAGGPFDSQTRFIGDIEANRLVVLGSMQDPGQPNSEDLFFKLTNHASDQHDSVYLRAILWPDGNIQYANYMNQSQFTSFMQNNNVPTAVYNNWLHNI